MVNILYCTNVSPLAVFHGIVARMKITASIFLSMTAVALAEVRLPAVISDNMVLLQDAKANVWGWADAGEKVSVTFGETKAAATADEKGRWSVKLEGLKPGAGRELTVTGKNTLTVKNVAVGEVWLASGQSNMEMEVKSAKDAEAEITACKFPDIRIFTVTQKLSAKPLEDCEGKWEVATPENAGHFTAAGYFFAREVHQKLKVPVGVIHASWGGTPVEAWMPEIAMKSNAAFGGRSRKIRSTPELTKFFPPSTDPTVLFNGMIAPVAGCTIRGAIWYQGEANGGPAKSGDHAIYGQLFPMMILSWRYEFAKAQGVPRDEAEFPFLYVQLVNFGARHEEPTDSYWAEIREAQFGTLEVPRTGMAVGIDVGDAKNIHPKNKQVIGHRLALSALAQVYFQEMEYSGPLYGGMQNEESKIRLSFSNSNGLKTSDGGPIKGFALAGEDKKFVWADAVIEGDHIVVSSPKVPSPVAIRYGWADNPDCNLINSAGLPASPFRSDKWPQNPPPGSKGM